MGKKNRSLYYSWWTDPNTSPKAFTEGLEKVLADEKFKSDKKHRSTREGVTVEVTTKEVRRRESTDVRIYAQGGVSFEELESLRAKLAPQIYNTSKVTNEFYGEAWDPDYVKPGSQ